jgi:bacterioferritin (cytochrome b1)
LVVSLAPGAASTSRRTLLRTSGASLGAALALAACGNKSHKLDVHKLPPQARNADVEILNGALDVVHKAIAAYTAGIPLLSGRAHAAAKQFLSQELTHAGELAGLIKQAGGKPNKARASYDLGRPRSRTDVLELLHELERTEIAGYVAAVPNVSPGSVRAAVAAILGNDAQHVVVLRSILGLAPLAGAQVTGSE